MKAIVQDTYGTDREARKHSRSWLSPDPSLDQMGGMPHHEDSRVTFTLRSFLLASPVSLLLACSGVTVTEK